MRFTRHFPFITFRDSITPEKTPLPQGATLASLILEELGWASYNHPKQELPRGTYGRIASDLATYGATNAYVAKVANRAGYRVKR